MKGPIEMKEIPAVETIMTSNPVTVASEKPAGVAIALMNDLGIRHLPVTHGPRLVGVISERDLSIALDMQKQSNIVVKVGDLCTYDVYTVSPQTPIDEVLENMERRAIGSTVVLSAEGQILGMVTNVDVCKTFKDFLRSAALREPAAESYLG